MKMKHDVFQKKYSKFFFVWLIAVLIAAFISCGSDNDDDDPVEINEQPAQVFSGTFIGSAISGMTFTSGSESGTIDADGTFTYPEGESVTFKIGELVLGSAPGAETISPIDLAEGATDVNDPHVTNICVFLQTLDQDGDLNNGIHITTEIADAVSAYADKINFDQSTADFAADGNVTALLADLNAGSFFTDTDPRDRTLQTAQAAADFLKDYLSERKTVTTAFGDLRGFAPNDNTWAWHAVPYAKPPLGELRWRPPQPPEPWTGVRDAVAWSDQSAQNPTYQRFGLGGMSEDSLYLNITAPRDADGLPVMVWFHGGGFVILTGNTSSFNNPTSLPTKGVVLVTVNHRLGPFGYMAHPLLTAESENGGSGNFGQLDLIAALEWIRDNIANFGGDPDNVTIFGESGGGGKSISLMASPLAAGLFHKVICQSGTAAADMVVLNGLSLIEAETTGTALADRLGAKTLAELRSLSWVDIINSELEAYNGDLKDAYGPVVDNYYMEDILGNIIQAGLPSNVPFMVGVNSADMAGLGTGMVEQMPWRCDNNAVPQFAYFFSHVPENWASKGVGAYHGIELVYVFNYPGSFMIHYLMGLTGIVEDPPPAQGETSPAGFAANPTGYGPVDLQVTDNMMTMWTNFAKTGNPSIEGIIEWTPYTTENDAFLEIGAELNMRTGLADVVVP